MDEQLLQASRDVFQYPSSVTERRHGPAGYVDYKSYKSWLRDEFSFRCIYCLVRERWRPDGHQGFSVEHAIPKVASPQRWGQYDNLLYACSACNAYRQQTILPIDVRTEPLGRHVHVRSDGSMQSLTDQGRDLISICQLDRPLLREFRRRMLALLRFLASRQDEQAIGLPNVAIKRPPGGNQRPAGITDSFCVRRQRKELPRFY